MSELIDFVKSAFPWMVIGFWVAVTCLNMNLKKDERRHGSVKAMGFASFICFVLVAIMEFADGDKSNGTVFLVLGIVQFVISMNNSKISDADNENEDNENKTDTEA